MSAKEDVIWNEFSETNVNRGPKASEIEVSVSISAKYNAETDDKLYMVLVGENSHTRNIRLDVKGRDDFQRGKESVFQFPIRKSENITEDPGKVFFVRLNLKGDDAVRVNKVKVTRKFNGNAPDDVEVFEFYETLGEEGDVVGKARPLELNQDVKSVGVWGNSYKSKLKTNEKRVNLASNWSIIDNRLSSSVYEYDKTCTISVSQSNIINVINGSSTENTLTIGAQLSGEFMGVGASGSVEESSTSTFEKTVENSQESGFEQELQITVSKDVPAGRLYFIESKVDLITNFLEFGNDNAMIFPSKSKLDDSISPIFMDYDLVKTKKAELVPKLKEVFKQFMREELV